MNKLNKQLWNRCVFLSHSLQLKDTHCFKSDASQMNLHSGSFKTIKIPNVHHMCATIILDDMVQPFAKNPDEQILTFLRFGFKTFVSIILLLSTSARP